MHGCVPIIFSDAFMKLPQITLSVSGKDVKFLADTGATHSIIKRSLLPTVKLSGRTVLSVGGSGVPLPESFSTSLLVDAPDGAALKHSFLLSDVCPINSFGEGPSTAVVYWFTSVA